MSFVGTVIPMASPSFNGLLMMNVIYISLKTLPYCNVLYKHFYSSMTSVNDSVSIHLAVLIAYQYCVWVVDLCLGTGLPIGYSVIVALTTGLPIGYSVIVVLTTGLPIGYSVIVALTGLPIGYSVIVG